MQRGLLKYWPCRVTAVLAVTTALSCGTGIRDGEGPLFESKVIGQQGGRIEVGEATLDIWKDCLSAPALITLRRFPAITHTGAVGPVFEIEIPAPDTFINDPQIGIQTWPDVAKASTSVIGFLIPGVDGAQWVPDSPAVLPVCDSGVVCGPVQILSFTKPGGSTNPTLTTSKLDLAIVQKCSGTSECPVNQACSSGACQACATGGECKRATP